MATGASAAARATESTDISVANRQHAKLNVYGNNVASNFRNISLWTADGGKAQAWKIQSDIYGNRVILSNINTAYALTVDRRSGSNWNAVIHTYAGDQYDASVECFQHWDSATNTWGYTWQLMHYKDMMLKTDNFASYPSSACQNVNVHWVYNTSPSNEWQNYVWSSAV